MNKSHTPLLDDFVNELLGDDTELQDAANQDNHSSTQEPTEQTSIPIKSEVVTVKEEQNHAPAPAEPDDYHAATEAQAAQTITKVATEAETVQTSTQDKSEMQAVEELSIEDNYSPTQEPAEQTITKVATEAETVQTSTQAEPGVPAAEEASIEDKQTIEEQHDQTASPEEIEELSLQSAPLPTPEPEVAKVVDTPEPNDTPTKIEDNVSPAQEQAVQTSATAESEEKADDDQVNHAPTPAEIEASTVVEELSSSALDDYAKATAIIENFRANVGKAHTETTDEPADQTIREETTAEPAEQTISKVNTEAEVPVVDEISVEDNLAVEDHPASTKDQSDQTSTINADATVEPAEQTSTHAEPEVHAAAKVSTEDNLTVEDHPAPTEELTPALDPEDIAASVIADFDNEFPEQVAPEDHPASTEDQTEQTSTHAEPEVHAVGEVSIEDNRAVEDKSQATTLDADAIADSVIADFEAEFPDQAEPKVADIVPEENSVQPDHEAIAASVIEDFEAEFPEQNEREAGPAQAPEPNPDIIAASVIEDFESEFPEQSEEPTETEPAAAPDPDTIAASVIEDFEAEFPEQGTEATEAEQTPAPDPEAIAASVIADFDAEFPDTINTETTTEPADQVSTQTEPQARSVEEQPVEGHSQVTAAEPAEVTHDFPLDLQQWLQPPPLDDNEIEIVTYMRCVSFELQGQHYAAEVQTLLEVLDHADIVPIPSMRHPVLGILNLRGSIVPVIDPSTLLGLSPCTNTNTQLLVAEYDSEAVALPVSDVSEVVNIDQNDIQKPPQSAKHVLGLTPLGDEMLTLLDLKALINAILNH